VKKPEPPVSVMERGRRKEPPALRKRKNKSTTALSTKKLINYFKALSH